MNPVAERLVFIDKNSTSSTAELSQNVIGPREKASIEISLDLPDSIYAVLSLSAVDINQTESAANASNIVSELLFSSELSGYIHNPNSYFNETGRSNTELIDLVMLTHGWRSFDFQAITNGELQSVDYPAEQGVSISGRAFRIDSEKPLSEEEILLVKQDDEFPTILNGVTDKEGYFRFDNTVVFDNDSLIVKRIRKKNRNNRIRVEFDSTHSAIENNYIETTPFSSTQFSSGSGYLKLKNERRQIDEAYGFLLDSTFWRLDDVIVESYTWVPRPDSVLLKSSFGRADIGVDLEAPLIKSKNTDIFSATRGFIGNNDIESIRPGGIVQRPLFLLNDIEIDASVLRNYNVNMFDRVLFFRGGAKTVQYEGRAVYAFYLKPSVPRIKNNISLDVFSNGYQEQRVFYAPKYDMEFPELYIIPDRRVLLHWEPMISINGSEKRTIDFWSSELESSIAIEIQGLTSEGQPIDEKNVRGRG